MMSLDMRRLCGILQSCELSQHLSLENLKTHEAVLNSNSTQTQTQLKLN